jgi:hypothetical protein
VADAAYHRCQSSAAGDPLDAGAHPVWESFVKTRGDSRTSQPSPVLAYAFSPVHKFALGVASGLTSGGLVAIVTVVGLAISPRGEWLGLLSQFFYGYEVSLRGAAVGFFWAFVAGFVTGWFAAFLKNLFTALWMLRVRMKAAPPFLDHI